MDLEVRELTRENGLEAIERLVEIVRGRARPSAGRPVRRAGLRLQEAGAVGRDRRILCAHPEDHRAAGGYDCGCRTGGRPVTDEQEPISTVDTDSPLKSWDGVTYVIYAAERQFLPEDYQDRLEVARQAIGEPGRRPPRPSVPQDRVTARAFGLVSIFTNARWVAYVDAVHSLKAVYSVN